MKKLEDMPKAEVAADVRDILNVLWQVVEQRPMPLTMVAVIELVAGLIVTMKDPHERARAFGDQLDELVGIIEANPLRNPLLYVSVASTTPLDEAIKNLKPDGLPN